MEEIPETGDFVWHSIKRKICKISGYERGEDRIQIRMTPIRIKWEVVEEEGKAVCRKRKEKENVESS